MGHYIAFEASPRNISGIRNNIIYNKMQEQIELHSLAVGQSNGKLQFSQGPNDQSGWGGLALTASENSVVVDVVRLDEFWQRSEDINVLKIDVEGADTWVLKGAQRLLETKRIKTLYYEQNKSRMCELNIGETEAEEFLKAMQYSVTALSDPTQGLVEYHACPSPS